MSVNLFQTGTYVRCPGGGPQEHPDVAMANGVNWFALNVGHDPCPQGVPHDHPEVWDKIRGLCKAAAMPVGPWMHCRSMQDIEFLLGMGVDWQADFIGVNVEDVVADGLSLQEVGGYLLDFWVNRYGKPVHMATLPWVQNGQGWKYVDFAYIALEMFPEEGNGQKYLDAYQACITHAFDEGCKKVTLLYSTKSPRSVYPAAVAHCLYTADDAGSWTNWKDTVPQVPPVPEEDVPVPLPPLTIKQFPYTGPCFGPGANQTMNYSTVKGLKRGMIRLGLLNQQLGSETDDYGLELKNAMKKFQKAEHLTQNGNYARGEYAELRYARVPAGPNKGDFALDALALKYIREDVLSLCYPHPDVSGVYVGQGLHQTTGIYGNWAIDFMAPGGTAVLAPERCRIIRFSGHDPQLPPSNGAGIWGWSIYFETTSGYQFFSTHYGSRTCKVGQILDVGDQLGVVGWWPGDPGRSHTHLGCSSAKGQADAKKHILAISTAPRLPEL